MSESSSLFPAAVEPRRLPWQIHPALTEERLKFCARMLAEARADAIRLARPLLGDDGWSVGCRAYAFGRRRLCNAAEGGRHPWLGIRDSSNRFVFTIGDVDVRFYRGSAEEPTRRILRRHAEAQRQFRLALRDDPTEGLVFRFALEADEGGGTSRVVFLALRGEDHTECSWPVPLDAAPLRHVPDTRQLTLLGDHHPASA